MNLNVIPQLFGRLSERTKLIIVGLIAFMLGMFLSGRGSASPNGRYVPWGERGLLDTQTGQIWMVDDTNHFRRWASLPYF